MSDLKDKVIFFTGGTSGLGKVAAQVLASQGATVLALVRNLEKGEALRSDFKAAHPNAVGSIKLITGDLSSLDSIKVACEAVKSEYKVVDYLINNAGMWASDFNTSQDGIEMTFQVNVLAPLLITQLLWENLKKSDEARVIFTASMLHKGGIQFQDVEYKSGFSGYKAYQQSKLADILLVRYLHKYFSDEKIGFYSFHPGVISTDLGRDIGFLAKAFFSLVGKPPEKGAETLLYLAQSDKTDLQSGEYYADKQVKRSSTTESYNMRSAERLVKICERYLLDYIQESQSLFDIESEL
ncbi:MAG: SDR family NAD(P)-dependent oxidoreductase [Bernardetiaceae bacterium]|nr:SDR family NAD(P)-dependent oxidoreductase [Bernardetiaceae bacterium]